MIILWLKTMDCILSWKMFVTVRLFMAIDIFINFTSQSKRVVIKIHHMNFTSNSKWNFAKIYSSECMKILCITFDGIRWAYKKINKCKTFINQTHAEIEKILMVSLLISFFLIWCALQFEIDTHTHRHTRTQNEWMNKIK